MVCSVIDCVHTDSVDAQLLEFRDISVATVFIGNGIGDV
jgi:hypothetical protein